MLIEKKKYDHWGAVAHSEPYLDGALTGLPGEPVTLGIKLSKTTAQELPFRREGGQGNSERKGDSQRGLSCPGDALSSMAAGVWGPLWLSKLDNMDAQIITTQDQLWYHKKNINILWEL